MRVGWKCLKNCFSPGKKSQWKKKSNGRGKVRGRINYLQFQIDSLAEREWGMLKAFITFPEKDCLLQETLGWGEKDKYERRQFSDRLDHSYPLSRSQLELKIWSELVDAIFK